jgi:hypothetical protein
MKRLPLILIPVVILAACGFAIGCPMCKDSIPNGEAATAAQAGSLPSGFNYSVYYMLSGLFLTLGLISTIIYKGIASTNVRLPRGFEVKPLSPGDQRGS